MGRNKDLDDIESELDSQGKPAPTPQPTPIPEGAALNPNYVPGGAAPRLMPQQAAADTKGLEEPYVDPVSLAAMAATGGLSSGSAIMNAAKNKAQSALTGTLLDRIKAAAQLRSDRLAQNGLGNAEQAQNIGQNSQYKPMTQPQLDPNFQQQFLDMLRKKGTLGSGS